MAVVGRQDERVSGCLVHIDVRTKNTEIPESCTQSIFADLFPTGTETPSAPKAAPTMSKADEVIREEANAFDAIRSVEDEDAFGPIREGMLMSPSCRGPGRSI